MFKHVKELTIKWLKDEQGSALLLSSAAMISIMIILFGFGALQRLHVSHKEQITHLYNAVVLATAIDQTILTELSLHSYPNNQLLINNDGHLSIEELERMISFSNNQIINLETLENDSVIISKSDATRTRIDKQKTNYDKKASQVKIKFHTDSQNKVENITYKVNLAGKPSNTSENNLPYSSDEPFFYIISFNDDAGTGDYGAYDLTDNEISLVDINKNILTNVLSKSPEPAWRHVVLIPGDGK